MFSVRVFQRSRRTCRCLVGGTRRGRGKGSVSLLAMENEDGVGRVTGEEVRLMYEGGVSA